MTRHPDAATVRGEITRQFLAHRHLIVPPILEVGAQRPERAWWRDLRGQLGYTAEDWTGTDMISGPGVELVADLCALELPINEYNTVICAETLEHVEDPLFALVNLRHALLPGGWILVTMPFAFPVHNFPNDYWRFTPNGMRWMLKVAGFVDVGANGFNEFTMELRDHDVSEPVVRTTVPMHVFGMGKCPE